MAIPRRVFFVFFVLIIWTAALSIPALPQAATHAATHAAPLAGSPPMGWNSWDCYGTSVTEAQVNANADYMSKNLAAHGWQRDRPVVAELRAAPEAHPEVSGRLLLNDTVGGLEARGLHLDADVPPATPAVLVAAQLEDRMSYRAGFRNLRVLAHYNPSINYVLAVCDLASALRQGVANGAKDAPARP